MGITVRSVRPYELASTRARELLYAQSMGVGRRRRGALKWHARRRARSHVRRHFRSSGSHGDAKKNPSRRTRRRSAAHWLQLAKEGKCLETHRWLAKRFHMAKSTGLPVLPKRCVDRGVRSVVRAAEHGAVLCDLSFVRTYRAAHPPKRRWAGMTFVMNPRDKEKRGGWIFVHPLAERSEELRDCRIQPLLRFRLIGPSSRAILSQALNVDLADHMEPRAAAVFPRNRPGSQRALSLAHTTGLGESALWDEKTARAGSRVHAVFLFVSPAVIGGFGSGVDVLVPAGHGMSIWMSLILAGARAVGMDELRAIKFEGGYTQFPHDYPKTAYDAQRPRRRIKRPKVPDVADDTPHYSFVEDAEQLQRIVNLRPAAKGPRPQTQIWVPRVVPATAAHEIIRVALHACSKGTPRCDAKIVTPQPADVQSWRSQGHAFTGRHGTSADDPVGAVTTGGFSLLRGRGFASAAWITASSALELFSGNSRRDATKRVEAFVLYRNPKSNFLRTALAVPVPAPHHQPF